VLEHDKTLLVAQGGRGGRGNAHFVSSTAQAPRRVEKGKHCTQKKLELELKLISDIGLVGLPNSGKSTLLSALTKAQPKIGDYPFTTMTPNLGVLRSPDRHIVIADMPGIIAGAHSGKGLGHMFLRHIERTRLLVLVIDISVSDPMSHHQQIIDEFIQYKTDLTKKPRIVVFNKMDLISLCPKYDLDEKTFYVSALIGTGIKALAEFLHS
jgi:GTP-binding protein